MVVRRDLLPQALILKLNTLLFTGRHNIDQTVDIENDIDKTKLRTMVDNPAQALFAFGDLVLSRK